METKETTTHTSHFLNQKILEAKNLFSQKGFPTKKDEDWKYLSFTTIQKILNENSTLEVNHIDILLVKEVLAEKNTKQNIVFLNGHFSQELSSGFSDEVTIHTFRNYSENVDFQRLYNNSIDETNGFSLYNSAHITDGIYIDIQSNFISNEILHIYFFNHNATIVQPRILCNIGKNTQVSFLENHVNLSHKLLLENAVIECFLAENSHLTWTKIQNDNQNVVLIDATYITQQQNSTAKVNTVSVGNKQIRNSLYFYQKGKNCNSVLNGISILDNNQEVDNHTLVHHFEPNCESHELYRGIYKDFSHGIFNGKVIVEKEAQKLNAYQQNNTILLSENASIDTKPQLEIFADDVKCSHGCTIGQFDEDALFYLQTRGIPKEEAQGLLTIAFVNEVIESIENEEIRENIFEIISRKLAVNFDI